MLTSVLGRSVMAERHGRAPGSVLALHGWQRSRADFAQILDGFDALALDLPGFGTTPLPESAWSTADYAEQLAPLLAEMDRPVVLGHSFGGRVAVHLAARHPGLVSGVVLTGVPLLRTAGSGGARVARGYRLAKALHRVGVVSDPRMEAARQRYGSSDYRNATGVLREILVRAVNETYEPQLEAMAAALVPCRLVWGEHDVAAPPEVAERSARLLGAPQPVIVPGAQHLLETGLVAPLRTALVELGAEPHGDEVP